MSETRIIVIDDEEVVHASLGRIFERRGWAVESYTSAPAALERIAGQPFDLIITDLMMPEMDGIELLKALRRDKVRAPVIMITGYPTIRTAVQAMRLGARDYLSKPFTRKELLGPVLRALRQEGADPVDPDEQGPDPSVLAPGAALVLSNHAWAVYEQEGLLRIGVEPSFLAAVGPVTELRLPAAEQVVDQGTVGVTLVNAEGEEHGVAMPLSGQVFEVNGEVADRPGSLDAETWLFRLLPSHLADEVGHLTLRR